MVVDMKQGGAAYETYAVVCYMLDVSCSELESSTLFI